MADQPKPPAVLNNEFAKAWKAGLCVAVPHALISSYIVMKSSYDLCFSMYGEDWLHGLDAALMYILMNFPARFIPLPGITSIIIFLLVFAIVLFSEEHSMQTSTYSSTQFVSFFIALTVVFVLSVGLQHYFSGSLSQELCYRFPSVIRHDDLLPYWIRKGN